MKIHIKQRDVSFEKTETFSFEEMESKTYAEIENKYYDDPLPEKVVLRLIEPVREVKI